MLARRAAAVAMKSVVNERQRQLQAGDRYVPEVGILTRGVEDLDRSLAFYRPGSELPAEEIMSQKFDHGSVGFLTFNHGLSLALFPNTSLSKDAKINATTQRSGAVSIRHIVASKNEAGRNHAANEPSAGLLSRIPRRVAFGATIRAAFTIRTGI